VAPYTVERVLTTTQELEVRSAICDGPRYAKEAAAAAPVLTSCVRTEVSPMKSSSMVLLAGWIALFHGSEVAALAPQ
jgi:hypothetical protein